MHTLGIDYSTKKVAMAHLVPDGSAASKPVVSMSIPARQTDYKANFEAVMRFASARIVELAGDPFIGDSGIKVAIEMPIVGSSGASQTAIRMAMVCGALYNTCSMYYGSANVDLVAVSSWKKEVCGKGNLDKAQVGEWLQLHRPDLMQQCSNDDEVDATCIALWAQKKMPALA